MAPKRPSPLEDPPAALSSEEVESESESESEDEQEQKHKKGTSPSIPDKKPSKKAETQSSSSEEGSESESESDSEHPPRGIAVPNVEPIVSKPMDDAPRVKKLRSKSTAAMASVAAATTTKSAAKRPVENSGGEGKDAKRAKKKGGVADGDAAETDKKSAVGEDSKRPLFQRLWSEEDEIVILKGMIDYKAKNGADPFADVDAFHDFIKKSLHIDVTRTQLMDKMRRLKKKFENNATKGKNGEDRTFSKSHEQKAYDLSKKVWGKEANHGGGVDQATSKSNGKAKRSAKGLNPAEKNELLASLRGPMDAEEQDLGPSQVTTESLLFKNSIVASGLDEKFMKEGLGLIDSAKLSELEEKWRKMQVIETEIFLRRIELVREQTKLVLAAYKKH